MWTWFFFGLGWGTWSLPPAVQSILQWLPSHVPGVPQVCATLTTSADGSPSTTSMKRGFCAHHCNSACPTPPDMKSWPRCGRRRRRRRRVLMSPNQSAELFRSLRDLPRRILAAIKQKLSKAFSTQDQEATKNKTELVESSDLGQEIKLIPYFSCAEEKGKKTPPPDKFAVQPGGSMKITKRADSVALRQKTERHCGFCANVGML